VFIAVVYYVIDSVWKLMGTPLYLLSIKVVIRKMTVKWDSR